MATFDSPDHRWRWTITLTVALAAVLVSRLLALPSTVWEQDEAYLALAVERFDPARNRPQPPWSPLWVAVGRAGTLAGLDATRSLQLASLAASVLSLLPLAALWTGLLGRGRALLAALLFLATPVAWLSAGRALSETPATALLAAMCACWCGESLSSRSLAMGSLAGGAAFLVRPQLALAVALPALVVLAMARGRRDRALVVAPGLALATTGGVLTALAAGGVAPLRDSLARHAALHFGQLGGAPYGFAASGLARSLLHPAAGAAWVVLGVLGLWLLRGSAGERRRALGVIVASLAGVVLAVYGVASPEHARYFVPILALSAGLVAAGLTALLSRLAPVAIIAVITAFAWRVAPDLALYRMRPSPPVAALRRAAQLQGESGATIVVDRRLNAFVDYQRRFGAPGLQVVYDYEVQLGLTGFGGTAGIIAVFDANNPLAFLPAMSVDRFAWPDSSVRRLSPGRFVDITVAVVRGDSGGSDRILGSNG